MGVPEFNKIIQISANPAKKVEIITNLSNYNLPVGQTTYISLYAPVGYIASIVQMYIRYAPIAGATGTKTVELFGGGVVGQGIRAALVTGDGTLDIVYDEGQWSANLNLSPADPTAMFDLQKSNYFDSNTPLIAAFTNNTDVADGGVEKNIGFWCLLEKIA